MKKKKHNISFFIVWLRGSCREEREVKTLPSSSGRDSLDGWFGLSVHRLCVCVCVYCIQVPCVRAFTSYLDTSGMLLEVSGLPYVEKRFVVKRFRGEREEKKTKY